MDLKNLTASESKILLKDLKLYRDLTKKLWTRWKRILDKLQNNKSYFLVEYYPSISKDFAFMKASEIYKRVFKCVPTIEDVILSPKDSILGWIKVYMDDNLVDLSFSKIEKKLKK